ncbi:MAG: hypothetical protein H7066_20340, partial [Cytophagaceae bacterium]|nr:hypothetical protein [Gemmatimonadaceae bacterium]
MSIPTLLSDLASNGTFAPVAMVALRATLLLALTGLALLVVRRQSASRRHVIIVLGTAGSLGASVVAAAGMQWRVGILPPTHAPSAPVIVQPAIAMAPADVAPGVAALPFNAARIADAPVAADAPVVVDDATFAPAPAGALPSLPAMLGLLWIVGVAGLLGHYGIGVMRRTRLAWRASAPLPAP